MNLIRSVRGKIQVGLGINMTETNITKGQIFNAIKSSNILIPYADSDTEFKALLQNEEDPDIHYPSSFVPAKEIHNTYKIRLELVEDSQKKTKVDDSIINGTKKIIEFCEENPTSKICFTLFNSLEQSYTVFCGLIDNRLNVICAFVGKRIPEWALEK